jgi:hypothetical protein
MIRLGTPQGRRAWGEVSKVMASPFVTAAAGNGKAFARPDASRGLGLQGIGRQFEGQSGLQWPIGLALTKKTAGSYDPAGFMFSACFGRRLSFRRC